ncbi:helix-turn-helix transcriptional regulator [Microbacterium sp. NPDC016588]
MTLLNDSAVDTLAKCIRTARLIGGLKQDDLARAVGVARSTVNEWEHGRSEPSASKMFAIARATGQSLDWFAASTADHRSEG